MFIVDYLESIMLEYGIFEELVIDNGFWYSIKEFYDFVIIFGIKYIISFLYYV